MKLLSHYCDYFSMLVVFGTFPFYVILREALYISIKPTYYSYENVSLHYMAQLLAAYNNAIRSNRTNCKVSCEL